MPFQPGRSGNPSGRPKDDPRLREMAKAHTEAAFRVVVESLADPDKRIALKAAEVILDRGYGKPSQAIDLGSDPERPVVQKIVREIVRPPNPDGSGV